MRLRHDIVYDAPIAQVFEMLADPDFRRRSADAMGVISADVTIDRTGGGMEVRIEQVQPTEGVPSFARKFAGETTRIVQSESWDSPEHGTITIETPGKPTQMSGTISLSEADGRTTEALDLEVKVKVPLIGGKLESLMADLTVKGFEKEHETGAAWLKGGTA